MYPESDIARATIPKLENELLAPIMVYGAGRNGSTALMKLLGSDSRVFFEKVPPYEVRYLTYLSKLAALWELSYPEGAETLVNHYSINSSSVGVPPWRAVGKGVELSIDPLDGIEMLRNHWLTMSRHIRAKHPEAQFYAEKVLEWVPSIVNRMIQGHSIFLFRDPRDVFISSNDFMTKMGFFSFHRSPGDDDLDHAVKLSEALICNYENYRGKSKDRHTLGIRYEDLITDGQALCQKLNNRLGLKLSADHLNKHEAQHITSSDLQSSLFRWKQRPLALPVRHCLEQLLSPLYREMDYEFEESDSSPTRDEYIEFSASRGSISDFKGMEGMTVESIDDSGATISLSDANAWFSPAFPPFRAEDIDEIWICVTGGQGEHCSLSWRGRSEDYTREKSLTKTFIPLDYYSIVRFSVSNKTSWSGNIDELRINLFNGRAKKPFPGKIRWIKLIRNYRS